MDRIYILYSYVYALQECSIHKIWLSPLFLQFRTEGEHTKQNCTGKIRKPKNSKYMEFCRQKPVLALFNLFQRHIFNYWLFCDKHVTWELLSVVKSYWCTELKKYFWSIWCPVIEKDTEYKLHPGNLSVPFSYASRKQLCMLWFPLLNDVSTQSYNDTHHVHISCNTEHLNCILPGYI